MPFRRAFHLRPEISLRRSSVHQNLASKIKYPAPSIDIAVLGTDLVV
jgi:hypothetical protein